MKKISDAFETSALSVLEIFSSHSGVASFRIPVYQREYNWTDENIDRIFQDIISGIQSLASDSESVAYIGTIILINEKRNKERTFDGQSLAVVDGQQRLTTLCLMCCELQV